MTLEQAIEVLNERKHRGLEWQQMDDGVEAKQTEPYCYFTPFEAIAIAEAYVREAGK